MISRELIDACGGDWAGLGEVSGPNLLEMARRGELSGVFANDSLLLGVRTLAGQSGVYRLKHSDIAAAPPVDIRQAILNECAKYQGVPYELPPHPPATLDCSYYLLLVHANLGLPFTTGVRTAEQIRQDCIQINYNDVLPGDMLFFENTYNASGTPGPDGKLATHCGISLGPGTMQMWNAVEPAVKISDITDTYWQEKILLSGRHRALASTGGGSTTSLVNAIDVSSHQPRDISSYIRQLEIGHVVVKLYQTVGAENQYRAHASAQIASARTSGCTVGGYVWLYSDIAVRKQVDDALSLYRPKILWLDVEPYTDGSLPSIQQVVEAVQYCSSIGQPCGIYTGPWVWERYGGDTTLAQMGVPLWTAEYNDKHDLTSVRLYGGWTKCVGHQYTDKPVDRNVFAKEYAG